MRANMRRRWALGAAATAALITLTLGMAQDRAPATGRAGDYEAGQRGVITQAAAVAPPLGSEYGVGSYSLYTPELAAGDGRELVLSSCGGCHSTVYITMQPPLARPAWDATVHKMMRAFGAPISEEVARRIVDYLETHYSPGTRTR